MIETADEFARLCRSPDPRECRRATVEEVPATVWTEVVERYPEERMAVAQNKTVPLAVLETLVDDPDARVRYMVAMKRKLSPALLDRLSRDEDESVRMRVAQHKNTSRDTLESLRHYPWHDIRTVVDSRLGDVL